MALQYQPQVFTFNGSTIDSKMDEFQLQAPELLQADNVLFEKTGAITKREGFVALPRTIIGGGQITAGAAIQVFNNELLCFDGTYIYTFIDTVQAWQNRGLAISVVNDQRKIINTRVASQANPDATNLNGQELYIWEDDRQVGTGVRYSIIDSDSGAFILQDVLLFQLAKKPKVLPGPGNSFTVFYCPGTETIFSNTINTSSPNLIRQATSNTIPPTIITYAGAPSGVDGFVPYDAILLNNIPLIVWANNDGTLLLQYQGTNYVLNNSVSNVVTTIAVMADSTGIVWYSWANNASPSLLYLASVDSNAGFAAHLAPIVLNPYSIFTGAIPNIAMIEDITVGNCNLTYEASNGSLNNNFLINIVVQSDGYFGQGAGTQRSVGLASKPFKYNNQLFVNTVYQDNANLNLGLSAAQNTYFTMCLTQNYSAISKMNPQVSGGYRNNGLLAQCDPFLDAPSNFMFANQKCGSFTTNNLTSYSLLGINASYFDFTNVNTFNSTVGNNNLHIVGGIEKIYDGVSVVEDNFNIYSQVLEVSLNPGTALGIGQYQYAVVLTWTDADLQVQRSQPSVPLTINTTYESTATITVNTLCITDKTNPRTPVSIEVYRTALVEGVPSSILYKITNDLIPIVNNLMVDSITFVDNVDDATAVGNEPIYTESQLFNSAPPACSVICPFLTRTFISGLEDPNVIWTSQDAFELDNYNTTPTEFSPELIVGVNPIGGAITGMAELNGTAIIFKANTIFQFTGSGPNANGTSGSFTDATVIVEDTGCTNTNSIIRIPASQTNAGGLMYQSDKGIWLLDTQYLNHYIGAQVEQYNNYHITSAELLPVDNQVIFTTLEGTCLIYNYYFNTWNTWSYLPAIDSCIWQGQLALLQSDGTVLVQQENYYLDPVRPSQKNGMASSKPIVRTVQLPWLAFAGLQGYQSVRYAIILGKYKSPHTLNMTVSYDYDPTPKEPVSISSNFVSNVWGSLTTFGSGNNFGGGIFTPYEFQYNFGFPLCTSLSITLRDDPAAGNDVGAIWSAITFMIGVAPGATIPMPAQNKFTGVPTPNKR